MATVTTDFASMSLWPSVTIDARDIPPELCSDFSAEVYRQIGLQLSSEGFAASEAGRFGLCQRIERVVNEVRDALLGRASSRLSHE